MGLVRIRDVLNGKFYRIPDYQRSYAWEKRQVRELFGDLVEAQHLLYSEAKDMVGESRARRD